MAKRKKHIAEQFDLPIMMIIERKSPISGKINQMELDITDEQLAQYQAGKSLIQDVFPNLTPDEREFIKTGITPDEWEQAFSP
jgi:hypothetical protein